MENSDEGAGTREKIPHLKGLPAAATLLAGLGAVLSGGLLLLRASRLADGWVFLAGAGLACLAAGAVVGSLPWRLVTTIDHAGLALGWALGCRRIPWIAVRRVLVGTLGSGGERDPACVSLLLADGSEVLYAVLGKRSPSDHAAARALLEAARAREIAVETTTAPAEERREREQRWRRARLKGWR